MGIGTAAYMQRGRADQKIERAHRFTETLNFLEHCHSEGAAGIQAPLTELSKEYAGRVRAKAEEYGMYVEVSARLPKNDAEDLEVFERTVQATKAAGASVIRTVMLGGRRYETFKTLDDWKEFTRVSWRSLSRAEPVLRRHKVRLALENHKDWRIDEMLKILKRIESEWVGVTVDTGNNMSLLEDPLDTVKAFAPYATAVHLKDMGIEAYKDGFLLAEVPFGAGCLDMAAIVNTIRSARPEVRFTLEMITRDPLKVPCLRPQYWITMGRVPGKDLAASLSAVQSHEASLPLIDGLAEKERFRIEHDNNRACLEYAKAKLAL
jgi:sugar phosphate isomerase/epimerase